MGQIYIYGPLFKTTGQLRYVWHNWQINAGHWNATSIGGREEKKHMYNTAAQLKLVILKGKCWFRTEMQRVNVASAFTQALQPHWQLLENTTRPQICANHTYVQNMQEPLSELQLNTSQSQFLGKLGEGGELSYPKPQQQCYLNLQGVRAIADWHMD